MPCPPRRGLSTASRASSVCLALSLAACATQGATAVDASSNAADSGPSAGADGGDLAFTTGAAVRGVADTHCGSVVQAINAADCHSSGTADGGLSSYGATLYGSSGDDDG